MAVKKKGKLGGGSGAKKPAAPDVKLPYTPSQIWTAGVGALSRAQAGGTKLFDDLVREGSKLHSGALDAAQRAVMQAVQGAQQRVNRRVDDVRDQATETWDNLEKIFQTRVQRALHQLGMPTVEEINALTGKVDQLTRAVDKLAEADGKARTPAARGGKKKKTAARKKARSKASRSTGSRSGAVPAGGG